MDWGSPEFVIAIIVVSTIGWLANNWIRARHGYALENEWGGQTEKTDTQENARLRAENSTLKDQVAEVEKRMIVLERIVTDRGYNLADEIEALRDPQPTPTSADAGTPLNLQSKEKA